MASPIQINGMQGLADSLQQKINEIIQQKAPLYQRRVQEIWDEETQKGLQDAAAEFGSVQEAAIRREFFSAVKAFYNSYTPQYYTRNQSLYNLLNIPFDTWGRVAYSSYEDLIDESQMTVDRHGHSLYNKVFKQGWHGGAEGGEGHPRPGVPYWRTPEGQYYNWGRRARRARISPYDRFVEQLRETSRTELQTDYREIYTRHADEATARTQQRLPALVTEIFGQ